MSGSRFEIDLSSRDEMATAIPRFIIAAGDLSSKAGDHLIFSPFDLTTAKFSLLATLACIDNVPTMTELKDKVLRSSAHLTQSVDALEKEGLVKRVSSPTDRRVHLIEITEAGRRKYNEVQKFMEERMQGYMAKYTTEELRSLILLLGKFIGICTTVLEMENFCLFKNAPTVS